MEPRDKEWTGTPLDLRGDMNPQGVEKIIIEFGNGDTDTFRAKQRDEFASYELHQMSAYIESMAHSIRKGQKR